MNARRHLDRAHRRAAQLNSRQRAVLLAVAAGRVQRGVLYGDFEPYLLEGRSIGWQLRMLRLRMLVALPPLSPPVLTRLGETTVHALGATTAARAAGTSSAATS